VSVCVWHNVTRCGSERAPLWCASPDRGSWSRTDLTNTSIRIHTDDLNMTARTKHVLFSLSLAFIICVALAGWWLWHFTHTIVLSREEIQRAVEKKFPIEKRELILSATFSNPTVRLDEGSDRIGLASSVDARLIGAKALSGRLELDGRVDYDPPTGELYLTDPQVRTMEIAGLGERETGLAKSLASLALAASLDRVLLYRLKENKPKEAEAKRRVKSVKVTHGRVVIELD